MMSVKLRSRGFTLVELTCAMAVGSLILLAAASLLGSSQDGYRRVSGGMAVEREARAAISQLASDLSTATFHKDAVMDKSPAAWPLDRLGFLSLQPAHAQTSAGRIGDLCAVNYYVSDLTIKGGTVRCLMRGFRESSETFAALANDKLTPVFTAKPGSDEPVAFGVVSFEVRPISLDKSGQWTDWVRNDETAPEALGIRLVVARRSLAARLTTPGDWDGADGLGTPSEAGNNQDLENYGATIRFGNYDHP